MSIFRAFKLLAATLARQPGWQASSYSQPLLPLPCVGDSDRGEAQAGVAAAAAGAAGVPSAGAPQPMNTGLSMHSRPTQHGVC